MTQAVTQPALILLKLTYFNQDYEYFQTILKHFVNEFNHNYHQKSQFFLKKSKICPAAEGFSPDPHWPPAAGAPPPDVQLCYTYMRIARFRQTF